MATYYTKEKSKFGAVAGTILPFMRKLDDINDPTANLFRNYVPAGFLRCDGTVKSVEQYPTLAAICGTGANSKFAKDPDSLTDLQFQLPDLGSKYIRAAASSGAVLNDVLNQDTNVRKVGTETQVTSLVGDSVTIRYDGYFEVVGQTIDFGGNPLYTASEPNILNAVLTEENFQAHGHNADVGVMTYTGDWTLSGYAQREFSGPQGGNDAQIGGQNQLVQIDPPTDAPFTISHTHRIDLPSVSEVRANNTLQYNFPNTQISADGLETEVFITTENVKKLDNANSPYIIVEYIIKI